MCSVGFFGGKSEANHLLRLLFVKVFKIQPQNGDFPYHIKDKLILMRGLHV